MQTPDDKHHEELVQGLYDQLKPILEKSEQPLFIYLDDACQFQSPNKS